MLSSNRVVQQRDKKNFWKVVNSSRKYWSNNLDDALWAYMSSFKTPLGMYPFRLVYGKPYHLPIELKHNGYWATNDLTLMCKLLIVKG